jgi:hypothetical protein
VRVQVEVPTRLNHEQKAKLQEFAAIAATARKRRIAKVFLRRRKSFSNEVRGDEPLLKKRVIARRHKFKSMHRFYLPPGNCAGKTLRLDGREAHHALKVLRVKYGELVAVLDGIGNEFLCTVENCSRDAVTLSVSLKNFTSRRRLCPVTLLRGVPKGKIIEGIIQKSVELGAHRIVPILSERVVTQLDGESGEHKREKWQQTWRLKPSSNAARRGCRKLKRR